MTIDDLFCETSGDKSPADYADFVTTAESRKLAAKNGWNVVVPRVDELQIDLDSLSAVEAFDQRLLWAQKTMQIIEVKRGPSKSGNTHVTLRVVDFPLTDTTRILLQAAFGSDFKKELISFQRVRNGEACPSIFFELPEVPKDVKKAA